MMPELYSERASQSFENLVDRIGRQRSRVCLWSSTRRAPTLISRLWWLLLFHASIFENVGPLATRPSMTMLQVLTEVVGAEEFLRIVTFPEFVHCRQVLEATVPIWSREIGEFLTAIPACVV